MKLEDALKIEQENKDQIYLFPFRGFYNGFNLSAYLFEKFLWPGIEIKFKHVYKVADYLKIGFPYKSFEKKVQGMIENAGLSYTTLTQEEISPTTVPVRVVRQPKKGSDLKPGHPVAPAQNPIEKNSEVPIIVISSLDFDRDVYIKWHDEKLADHTRAEQLIKPFYGGMPVFRGSYDSIVTLFHITKNLPKPFQDTIGAQIATAVVEINILYYQCNNAIDNKTKVELIDKILIDLNTLKFLARICHDLGSISDHQVGDFGEKLIDMEFQTKKWRAAIARAAGKRQANNQNQNTKQSQDVKKV